MVEICETWTLLSQYTVVNWIQLLVSSQMELVNIVSLHYTTKQNITIQRNFEFPIHLTKSPQAKNYIKTTRNENDKLTISDNPLTHFHGLIVLATCTLNICLSHQTTQRRRQLSILNAIKHKKT